jgi:hypothetical protein
MCDVGAAWLIGSFVLGLVVGSVTGLLLADMVRMFSGVRRQTARRDRTATVRLQLDPRDQAWPRITVASLDGI